MILYLVAIIAVGLAFYFAFREEDKTPKNDTQKEEKPKKEPSMTFNVGDKVKVYQGASYCLQEDGKLLDGKILARKRYYSMEYDGHAELHKEYVVKCGKYTILVSEDNVFPVEEVNNENTR